MNNGLCLLKIRLGQNVLINSKKEITILTGTFKIKCSCTRPAAPSILLIILIILLRTLQYRIHLPVVVNFVAVGDRVRIVRAVAHVATAATVIIIVVGAVFGGVALGLPLDVGHHDGVALLGLLLDALIIEVAVLLQILLKAPLPQQPLALPTTSLPLASSSRRSLLTTCRRRPLLPIPILLITPTIALLLTAGLAIKQRVQLIYLHQSDILDSKLYVWPDHELLEVLVFDKVVLDVLECDDVLLDAVDLVLGVLHDYLVVLVLNFARALHLFTHSVLGAQVHLVVMKLLLDIILHYLRLQQFLLDEHAGEHKRIQEVLIRPVLEEALSARARPGGCSLRPGPLPIESCTLPRGPLLEVVVEVEEVGAEGSEPVGELGLNNEQHLTCLRDMQQQLEPVEVRELLLQQFPHLPLEQLPRRQQRLGKPDLELIVALVQLVRILYHKLVLLREGLVYRVVGEY